MIQRAIKTILWIDIRRPGDDIWERYVQRPSILKATRTALDLAQLGWDARVRQEVTA